MKKIALTTLSLFMSVFLMAQVCTPGPITDPGGNGELAPLDFPNVFTCEPSYEAVVTVIVPTDTTILPFITCTVNTLTLDGIVGLPSGFTYACNPGSCVFGGGDTVCVSLVGTPALSVPGDYPISISTTTNLTCPILGTFDEVGTTESGITIGVYDCPDCTTLGAPVGLKTIPNYYTNEMELSWSPVQGAAGYRVTAGLVPGPLNKNLSPDIGEFNNDHTIPFGALTDGWVVHWAVVAGCGTPAPPITPFSVEDTFTFSSSPRLAAEEALLTQDALNGISVYPNPASEHLLIQLNSEINQEVSIRIYDELGRVIRSQETEFFQGTNMIRYDVSSYETGLYVVELTTDTGKSIKKFTVVKQ